MTPSTVAFQAPVSMGFFQQEYWCGLPFPSLGDLPTQGLNLCLLHLQADSLSLSYLGSPLYLLIFLKSFYLSILFEFKDFLPFHFLESSITVYLFLSFKCSLHC